jgi:hypothetical protein
LRRTPGAELIPVAILLKRVRGGGGVNGGPTQCASRPEAAAAPVTYASLAAAWDPEPGGRYAKRNEPPAPGDVAPIPEDVRLSDEPLIEGNGLELGEDLSGVGWVLGKGDA